MGGVPDVQEKGNPFGRNPTFSDNDPNQGVSAETHIFDFNQDIYGKPIKVNLLRFLRGEHKFSGPEELSRQIAKDIEEAKQVLADAQKEVLLSCEDKFNR